MSHRAASCLIAALISIFMALVAVEAFRLVQKEDRAGVIELAHLKLGDNRYPIVSTKENALCVGEIVAALAYEDDQYTVTTKGWLRVGLYGATWNQEFTSNAAFNPLGQLSAAIVSSSLDGRTYRLGLRNINPITVQFLTGPPTKSIFEQSIPGPIEITKRDDELVITTRSLADILPGNAQEQVAALPLPIRIEREDGPLPLCNRDSGPVLDLTGVLRGIATLNSKIGAFFPPVTP